MLGSCPIWQVKTIGFDFGLQTLNQNQVSFSKLILEQKPSFKKRKRIGTKLELISQFFKNSK
jgi:hypothetical protein